MNYLRRAIVGAFLVAAGMLRGEQPDRIAPGISDQPHVPSTSPS